VKEVGYSPTREKPTRSKEFCQIERPSGFAQNFR
jgi:hypothetical protein